MDWVALVPTTLLGVLAWLVREDRNRTLKRLDEIASKIDALSIHLNNISIELTDRVARLEGLIEKHDQLLQRRKYSF
jgi:hypothetical protein